VPAGAGSRTMLDDLSLTTSRGQVHQGYRPPRGLHALSRQFSGDDLASPRRRRANGSAQVTSVGALDPAIVRTAAVGSVIAAQNQGDLGTLRAGPVAPGRPCSIGSSRSTRRCRSSIREASAWSAAVLAISCCLSRSWRRHCAARAKAGGSLQRRLLSHQVEGYRLDQHEAPYPFRCCKPIARHRAAWSGRRCCVAPAGNAAPPRGLASSASARVAHRTSAGPLAIALEIRRPRRAVASGQHRRESSAIAHSNSPDHDHATPVRASRVRARRAGFRF